MQGRQNLGTITKIGTLKKEKDWGGVSVRDILSVRYLQILLLFFHLLVVFLTQDGLQFFQ